MVDRLDQLPAPLRDEARLHHARALLFSGDPAGSKREIADWGGPIDAADDELLRELADAYQRLDAFALAIDVERFRSSRLAPGSLPWFESRYGLALAYYRADRAQGRPAGSSTPRRSSTPTSAAASSRPGSNGSGRGSGEVSRQISKSMISGSPATSASAHLQKERTGSQAVDGRFDPIHQFWSIHIRPLSHLRRGGLERRAE